LESLLFGLKLFVTYHVPDVLLAEIGQSDVDPPDIEIVVGFWTFLGHRPKYRRTPAIVQLYTT
jgi:hypothetical protein